MNLPVELSARLPINTSLWPPVGVYDVKRLLTTLTTGHNDLYTCPVGVKALVGPTALFNAGSGSAAPFPELKDTDDEYYKLSNAVTVAAGARNTAYIGLYVLEPGQSFAFNSNAGDVNIGVEVIEFAEDVALRTLIVQLDESPKTLYQCPVGKKALTVRYDIARFQNFGGGSILNESGGARVYKAHFVKSGDSVGVTTQMAQLNVGSGGGVIFPVDSYLEADDAVVIETDSTAAGQQVYMTVLEI